MNAFSTVQPASNARSRSPATNTQILPFPRRANPTSCRVPTSPLLYRLGVWEVPGTIKVRIYAVVKCGVGRFKGVICGTGSCAVPWTAWRLDADYVKRPCISPKREGTCKAATDATAASVTSRRSGAPHVTRWLTGAGVATAKAIFEAAGSCSAAN